MMLLQIFLFMIKERKKASFKLASYFLPFGMA